MLEIEIDGQKVEVAEGSTVMDAANKVGVSIPHFCYHKKLSIAANCRMCLVQVEKAPKPLPACATPVTNGMRVMTHSDQAVKAQKGVMEFLLINHPLDCPICDQGGECQLQDLAVGYGGSSSRYQEEKRVVENKNLGPLISTDMTRCIHCTRCVRFGQEIAGVMELGMANRGMHSEILSFVGSTVNSELSGNMIDLCPVGALTSKPFRYSARTWELSRRKSVSPHDGLGANLIVQVKHDQVKRVLPLDNEQINECWLSDRDRFSYEALNSEHRLKSPMLKQGGEWKEVDWQTALEYVAHALKSVAKEHGPASIGAMLSPHSTLEELYLAQRLMRGIGSGNVDFRLRQSDFTLDGKLAGAPWLGMRVSELAHLDRVLVVGSFLRKDHPLLAQRLRQAAKKGTRVNAVVSAMDDWLMPVANTSLVSPGHMADELAAIVRAVAETRGVAIPNEVKDVAVSEAARSIAVSLATGEKIGLFLGNAAQAHPRASQLHLLTQLLASMLGARFGVLGEAANSVGGYIAGAIPNGLNARQMVESQLKAYVVMHADPELDTANGAATLSALHAAKTVIALTPFRDRAMSYADCILPIAPFTETSGTFVNTDGRVQSFHAVVKPLGETRPAWKVLRVLGNLLGLPEFAYESSEDVRAAALGGMTEFVDSRLGNTVQAASISLQSGSAGSWSGKLERVADVPVYFADALTRRAPSLQATQDARTPVLRACGAQLERLGVQAGASVRVRAAQGDAVMLAELDNGVADGAVRIAAAHDSTLVLGPMFGELIVERA